MGVSYYHSFKEKDKKIKDLEKQGFKIFHKESIDEKGEFSFDKSADDVFYLQNGFYRFNGIWKQRGLGHLGTKEIEHLDTFEKNGKLFYRFVMNRNSRLRSSILQNRIQDIGKIKPTIREVNLNADSKRFWLGELSAINHETNDSLPISLNYFEI